MKGFAVRHMGGGKTTRTMLQPQPGLIPEFRSTSVPLAAWCFQRKSSVALAFC